MGREIDITTFSGWPNKRTMFLLGEVTFTTVLLFFSWDKKCINVKILYFSIGISWKRKRFFSHSGKLMDDIFCACKLEIGYKNFKRHFFLPIALKNKWTKGIFSLCCATCIKKDILCPLCSYPSMNIFYIFSSCDNMV